MNLYDSEGGFVTVEQEKLISNKTISKKKASANASHYDELMRLKRIKGQVQGIENMIESGRYCPEILAQVKAAISALRSVEYTILERHMRHCLANAVSSGSKSETNKKINEIISLLGTKSF